MARYRLRTWLRGHAPSALARRIPKGPRDCGAHQWYRASDSEDRCYHCAVGARPHVPTPLHVGGPEWDGLLRGAVAGNEASTRILVRRLDETASSATLGARAALERIESAAGHRGDGGDAIADLRRRARA